MARRILGQDFAPTTARTIQQVGTEVGKQQNFLQSGLEFADRTGQGISQSALTSLQSTRELANTQAEIAAQNQQRLASGGSGGILGGLADLLEGYSEFEKNRVKGALAQQETQGKREFAFATQELQAHIADGSDFMLERGEDNFESKGLSIVGKYPNISPTDVVTLTKALYSKLGTHKTAQNKKLVESIEQVAKHRLEVIKKETQTRAVGIMQQVENNPELAGQKIKELDNLINSVKEANPQLTRFQMVEIETGILGTFQDRVQAGTQAHNAIVAKQNNLNRFAVGSAEINQEFADQPFVRAVKINELAIETGVTEAIKNEVVNAPTLIEQQTKLLKIQKEYNALKGSIYEQQESVAEIDRKLQKQIAYGVAVDPDLITEIEGTSLSNNVNYQVGVKAGQRIRDYYDLKLDIDFKKNQIKQEKLVYLQRMNAFIGGQGTKKDLTAIQELSRILRNDNLSSTKAEQSDNEVQTKSSDALFGTDVAERTKAQAEWRTLRDQIEETYDDAIKQYNLKLTSAKRGLERYDLPETLDKLGYELTQQDVQNAIDQGNQVLNTVPKNQGVGTGTGINFNQGDVNKFVTMKSDRVGADILLPFAAGTKNLRISGQHADWRPITGTYHAGLDIAAPMGTPLISLVKGTVSQVRNQGNTGYGHYIDITDDATGVVYRYGHLREKPDLKAGDVVGVGDPIGNVGSSGRSSGPHLDLSIRRDPTQFYGFKGSTDPEVWLAQKLKNAQAKSDPPPGDNLELQRKDPGIEAATTANQDHVVGATDLVLPGNRVIKYNIMSEGNSITPVKEKINEATPIVPRLAPYDKNGWGLSDNIGSYGYAFLERNQDFRDKLNSIANELQIPANWLVDVIAYENNFDHKQSDIGAGFYGIANLSEREITELAGADFESYMEMSPTEQLAVVGDFIKNAVGTYGAIDNLGGLAALFFAGEYGYSEYKERGIKAFGSGRDGNNMTFPTYLEKLGAGAKRKYKIPGRNANLSFMSPIHTEYHEQCSYCRALRNSGSEIVPHHGLIA